MNIQVIKTYKESFHDVLSHKMEWARAAYGPVILWAIGAILLGIGLFSSGYVIDIEKVMGDYTFFLSNPFLTFSSAVFGIFSFIALISIAINGYRYAILQESRITLNFNLRFIKMVLFGILVSILAGLYLTISGGIVMGAQSVFDNVAVSWILGILFALYGLFLFFRIVLYPVIISIDQSEPLRISWRLMKGNILRYIALIILITITISIIGFVGGTILGFISYLLDLLSSSLASSLAFVGVILNLAFGIFMLWLSWAVNSKALGLVYQDLSKK